MGPVSSRGAALAALATAALVTLPSGLPAIGAPIAHAADQAPATTDPADIVRRSVAAQKLPDEREDRTMRIIGPSGDAREREITVWSITTAGGRTKTLARFTAPRDVEGTAILTWEGEGGQPGDQWFYLPALHKAKRVASGGRRVRFMGTDFAYEDLSQEDPSAWKYTSAGDADVDGAPCWILEATPASASVDTGYSKRRLSIRKDNLYIVRRELFDASGKLAKVQSDRRLVNVAGSAWRADEITMEDKLAGTSTTLTIRNREHGKGLKEDMFTTAALESGDDF